MHLGQDGVPVTVILKSPGLGHSSLTIDVAISSLQTTIFLTNNVPGVGLMLVILLVFHRLDPLHRLHRCLDGYISCFDILVLVYYHFHLLTLFVCMPGW
jgi:hypothetical protein